MKNTIYTIPNFPCAAPPEGAAARLLGLYPQNASDAWMQRIRVPAGRLSAHQWHAVAALAHTYAHDHAHLTTRQELELHHIPTKHIPDVQHALHAANLTGRAACGDSLRNPSVCPCQLQHPHAPDLDALAASLLASLFATDGAFQLPRKFKISLSCHSPQCPGQPYLHDLALVLRQHDRQWGFRVLAAGSLGRSPSLAIQIFDFLPAHDALAIAHAALQLFAQHGDRTNRRHARLRHVRERLGDDAFTQLLRDTFTNTRKHIPAQKLPLTPADAPQRPERLSLRFVTGQLSVDALNALASLADRPDLALRIGTHHQLWLFGSDVQNLHAAIAPHEPLRRAAAPGPHIVACPGRRTCPHALVDTASFALKLADELPQSPSDVVICISGCPNGCAHSGVASIGLFGAKRKTPSGPADAFNIWTAGQNARAPIPAKPFHLRQSPQNTLRILRQLLDHSHLP